MKDFKNNNVEISGKIKDSIISVNQNQDGNQSIFDQHIEYQMDEESRIDIPCRKVQRSRKIFRCSLILSFIGLFSDVFGIADRFEIYSGHVWPYLLAFVFFILLITKKGLWLWNLPKGKSVYKDGYWYQRGDQGDFIKYKSVARCIYPKCNGIVKIVPAPPREYPNHTLIGMCSDGGVQHTYSFHPNFIGYPEKFDWRPKPVDEKGS